MSLNTSMLREVLTRLAESASDQSDELQNYVLEIFLTLETAIDNTEKGVLHPSHLYPDHHSRQASDITPTGTCKRHQLLHVYTYNHSTTCIRTFNMLAGILFLLLLLPCGI